MRAAICVLLIVVAEARELKIPRGGGPQVDVYPPSFDLPVPFGHIYKEGFADKMFGLKTPVDPLEYSMRTPKDLKEKLYLLEHANPENLQFYADHDAGTRLRYEESARDIFMKKFGRRASPKVGNDTLKWFDISQLQAQNAASPPLEPPRRPYADIRVPAEPPPKIDKIGPKAKESKFQELYVPPKQEKFTTCDEFAAGANFHPKDIFNLNWIPFYIWSYESAHIAIPHKFTYVTKQFASTYRDLYIDHKNIQWHRPKFMMQGRGEFLLIAADKKGLFHALHVVNLPENFNQLKNVTLPHVMIRMKTVDPYLALMYCEGSYATIMAVPSNVPPTDKEKIEEAESIGFHGPGTPVSRDEDIERREQELRAAENNEDIENIRKAPIPPFLDPQLPADE